MKKILLLVLFVNFFALYAEDKLDVTKKPDPLEKIEFSFPEYKTIMLSNGLKVFIIEDHEQPTISFRMNIGGGSSMDNGSYGVSEMVANLLEKGAGKRKALDIANSLDGVGATISATSGVDNINVSGNALKKHMKLLLEIFSDMIAKPTFDEDEFDKLKPQFISSIKDGKSKGGQIAAAMARKTVFGENHPYAGKQTEESINKMKLSMVKDFYKTYFKPNNATLAVVGDITAAEIIDNLEKAFKNWEKGEEVKINVPAINSMPLGVYYVNRPGSVQSSINITVKAIPSNHIDYEVLDIASSVIGSGFAGRLFRTLRETYSYTYTPFGNVSNSKFFNRFQCGAEVRNSVTDSSLDVTLEQLRLLATTPPSQEELDRIKKFEVGQYMGSFENCMFIAGLIQNADFNNISLTSLKTYPERIMAISPSEIQRVANEYMNPKKSYIVVVGAPEVKEKIARFGKVYEYDLDLNPISGINGKFEKAGVDAEELIENYIKAIGGKENIAKIKTLITSATADLKVQGRNIPGKMIVKYKAPNMMNMDLDMGVFKSKNWIDGTNAVSSSQDGITKLDGDQAAKLLFSANLFKETKLKELGYKTEVLGKQGNEIVLKATGKSGDIITYYFDATKFLINKIETLEQMPQGPTPVTETFLEYAMVDGLVLLPKVTENSNPMFTIKLNNSYTLNTPMEDSEFTAPK